MKQVLIAMFIVGLLSGSWWATARVVKGIQLDQQCGGYLKRAADANTIPTAAKELQIAVDYLRDHDMTIGYTSLLWRTPDEDMGFFYTNLSQALAELNSVPAEASSLERSNVLMKLRETLLDTGDKGSISVTGPDGLSVYPNNWAYFLWFILSAVFVMIPVGVVVVVEIAEAW
jgi:hypothetical protein